MANPKRLPSSLALAPTLAQRIRQLREFRNMTVKDLAKQCRFTVERIEDLEAGLESWLSTTDRQVLAKSLVVEPYALQEVEVRAPGSEENTAAVEAQLIFSILAGNRDLECPKCGSTLKCSVVDALDIEARPVRFAKAFCERCPYVLKQ